MLCWAAVVAAGLGSRSPSASGAIKSASAARTRSAFCQPMPPISPPSTGTIRNCPNEPAAAVIPIAQLRRSGATLRPITP
jgi:hypothetical protein